MLKILNSGIVVKTVNFSPLWSCLPSKYPKYFACIIVRRYKAACQLRTWHKLSWSLKMDSVRCHFNGSPLSLNKTYLPDAFHQSPRSPCCLTWVTHLLTSVELHFRSADVTVGVDCVGRWPSQGSAGESHLAKPSIAGHRWRHFTWRVGGQGSRGRVPLPSPDPPPQPPRILV